MGGFIAQITKMKLNHKAQATTELAIFGSLILVCFAILISYGMSLQEQQILQQQAFRKALEKSYNDNAFVSYNIVKHPRTVNLFGKFGEGGRSSTSAGASVAWCLGEPEEKSYYQINEDTVEIPGDSEIVDVETEAGTTYAGQERRSEDSAGITTYKKADSVETLTTRLKVNDITGRMTKSGGTSCENVCTPVPGGGGAVTCQQVCTETQVPYSIHSADDIVVTQGLDTDGRYRSSAVSAGISREREWSTPHAQ